MARNNNDNNDNGIKGKDQKVKDKQSKRRVDHDEDGERTDDEVLAGEKRAGSGDRKTVPLGKSAGARGLDPHGGTDTEPVEPQSPGQELGDQTQSGDEDDGDGIGEGNKEGEKKVGARARNIQPESPKGESDPDRSRIRKELEPFKGQSMEDDEEMAGGVKDGNDLGFNLREFMEDDGGHAQSQTYM